MMAASLTRRQVLAAGVAATAVSAIGIGPVSAEPAVTCLYDETIPFAGTFAAAASARGARCVRISVDAIGALRKDLASKTPHRLIGMAGYAKFLLLREALAEGGFRLEKVIAHAPAIGGGIEHFAPESPTVPLGLPAGPWPAAAAQALLGGRLSSGAHGAARPAPQGRRFYSWLARPAQDKRCSHSVI